ncbi:MAG: maltokinase [Chloroflexota bacterium]|nr:maltokinase [Chloroflexota bacterium]
MTADDGRADRYLIPFVTGPGTEVVREALPGDGAWRALAVAMAAGRVLATDAGGALVCRPGLALPAFAPGGAADLAGWDERALGADQSNTSVAIGARLLLKAYRRMAPGVNPELEMLAYLAEERVLRTVPALAGWAEYVGADGAVATVAILQELIPEAHDAYESTAERLASWIAAPGAVALEYATEDAAELGTALAELHAALADAGELGAFAPRLAEAADLARLRTEAESRLDEALGLLAADDSIGADLRLWEPEIRDRLAAIERPSAPPLLTRIHGDLHLGQVLRTPDGSVFVDFEGDPLRPLEERRRLEPPLRDVASLLLSLDHVSTGAERRAVAGGWRPDDHAGLDIAAWRRRTRERLLAGYRAGLRRAGAPIALDETLLDGLAVAKECAELVYAATYLPDWLWAPHAGMRRLIVGEAASGGVGERA